MTLNLAGPAASLPTFPSGAASSPPLTVWPSAVTGTVTGSRVSAMVGCDQPSDLARLPGFGSVLPKLIKKTLANEYVDIWELLPETWQVEADTACCHPSIA